MDIFKIRDVIKKTLGDKGVNFFAKRYNKLLLVSNFYTDYKIYNKYSTVFSKKTYGNIESEITLRYHSLEKGFVHSSMRYRFGKKRVKELIDLLMELGLEQNYKKEQIKSAVHSLCFYYNVHQNENVDISDYFSKETYEFLSKFNDINLKGVKNHKGDEYFKDIEKRSFKDFSISRCSVRDFSKGVIPKKDIEQAVNLANNAPSVCNRQASSVHLLENPEKIAKVLKIQKGLRGYEDKIQQLLILTCDRSYFYTVGERYQYYIDGGIYLMNLLYSLHFYKIVACPAHFALTKKEDIAMMNLLSIPESQKVICIIPIGLPSDDFKTTLSLRKTYKENFNIID